MKSTTIEAPSYTDFKKLVVESNPGSQHIAFTTRGAIVCFPDKRIKLKYRQTKPNEQRT